MSGMYLVFFSQLLVESTLVVLDASVQGLGVGKKTVRKMEAHHVVGAEESLFCVWCFPASG